MFHRYGHKYGFPILDHVALPKIGAMQAILETLGPNGKENQGMPLVLMYILTIQEILQSWLMHLIISSTATWKIRIVEKNDGKMFQTFKTLLYILQQPHIWYFLPEYQNLIKCKFNNWFLLVACCLI